MGYAPGWEYPNPCIVCLAALPERPFEDAILSRCLVFVYCSGHWCGPVSVFLFHDFCSDLERGPFSQPILFDFVSPRFSTRREGGVLMGPPGPSRSSTRRVE